MHCISRPRNLCCCIRDGTLRCLQTVVHFENGTSMGSLGLFVFTAVLGLFSRPLPGCVGCMLTVQHRPIAHICRCPRQIFHVLEAHVAAHLRVCDADRDDLAICWLHQCSSRSTPRSASVCTCAGL